MTREAYERFYVEINEGRFDSPEALRRLAQLGPPALAFRAFAQARCYNWGLARDDFRAAIEHEKTAKALVCWVSGAGLFAVRDYSRAIATLIHAAEITPDDDEIGVRVRARKLAVKLCTHLGWLEEARELRETIAREDIKGRKHLRSHSLELQRQAAIRRRAQAAGTGTPFEAARKSYALLFRDGADAARRGLDDLIRRHPEQVAPQRMAIRLELLSGQIDAAKQRLEHARAKEMVAQGQLRGEQAALALAMGRHADALRLTEDPEADARLLYLRGLAHWYLGQHQLGAEVLERARVASPGSIGILLALAVARYQADPDSFDGGTGHRFDELIEWAPTLLNDAAESMNLRLWRDKGPTRDRVEQAELMRRAHELLTAEHDLDLASYRMRTGKAWAGLRHVANMGRGPSMLEKLQVEHAGIIERYEATLVWDIGVRPEPPQAEGEKEAPVEQDPCVPWKPRFLTPEQIEQFLEDGFIVIPKTFDEEVAKQVREAAVQRIRRAPERWVRDYDSSDPSRSLANFDPSDPETCDRSRIELSGPGNWVIEELAPNAWAAICDLLGGPGRVDTKIWGDYLLLCLRYRGGDTRARPGPRAEGWHIDDPGPSTRLTNIRNGLVCVVLFDDLLPRSGNTWLAPDSVGRVARELAAHPEGVDFVHNRGTRITTKCKRFHEIVGNAGDVVLIHPLMMHSASNNPSDRIRWMANPMIYLRDPLDPFRDAEAMSPVELAIHRAISEG